MERTKKYSNVVFSAEIIKEARDVMVDQLGKERRFIFKSMRLNLSENEHWNYDDEEEFFGGYRDCSNYAHFEESYDSGKLEISVYGENSYTPRTEIVVRMRERGQIMKVFNIFDANVERCKLPEKPDEKVVEPRIFIGHGNSSQWKELKDHLHEKQGFEVEAYEMGARAGFTVKEVLDEMLAASSFALLVLTGEDEDAQGKMHARENVIHELGLFQGRLGWRKAIILLEEGVQEFSNIHGVNTIRFSKDAIREGYGEVLATIKREFR